MPRKSGTLFPRAKSAESPNVKPCADTAGANGNSKMGAGAGDPAKRFVTGRPHAVVEELEHRYVVKVLSEARNDSPGGHEVGG